MYKPKTLPQWQFYFNGLYGTKNTDIILTFIHFFEVASSFVRAIFEKNIQIHFFLSHTFAWICALSNQLNIDLEHCVWSKYPEICPYCQEALCNCATIGKRPIYDKENVMSIADANRYKIESSAYALEEWKSHFNNIYRQSNQDLHLVSRKFMEEIGEIAEGIKCLSYKVFLPLDKQEELLERLDPRLQDEMADIFAWYLAFVNKISLDTSELEFIIRKEYSAGCPKCISRPCRCNLPLYQTEKFRQLGEDIPVIEPEKETPAETITSEEEKILDLIKTKRDLILILEREKITASGKDRARLQVEIDQEKMQWKELLNKYEEKAIVL